jgi:hypothetical protein
MRGWGIKENNGGGEFNNYIRTFVNVTVYHQYNNNMSRRNISPFLKTPINCSVFMVCSQAKL